MTGLQQPEFRLPDGEVVPITNAGARRIVAALITLDATAPPTDKGIPFAKAMARVEAAAELDGKPDVRLSFGEDIAVLRALELISRTHTSSDLERLRQALERSSRR
jgi:hypothetical protein